MISTDTLNHIIELKKRLVASVLVFSVAFLAVFVFCRPLFDLLTQPILKFLPNSYQIVSTQITTPFTVLMKFSVFLALIIVIPYLLFQLWSFIAPGLYQHEKKVFFPLLLLSTALFYTGGLFAFFVVCPLALNFFYHFAPSDIKVMTDLGAYFGFISNLMLIFAFSFQIPIVIFSLLYFNLISIEQYVQKRPYIIVGCFIVGMLLTPPDVVSQVLLAVPLLILFELGVWLSKIFKPTPTMIAS